MSRLKFVSFSAQDIFSHTFYMHIQADGRWTTTTESDIMDGLHSQ